LCLIGFDTTGAAYGLPEFKYGESLLISCSSAIACCLAFMASRVLWTTLFFLVCSESESGFSF
jgi:hypothetical protein